MVMKYCKIKLKPQIICKEITSLLLLFLKTFSSFFSILIFLKYFGSSGDVQLLSHFIILHYIKEKTINFCHTVLFTGSRFPNTIRRARDRVRGSTESRVTGYSCCVHEVCSRGQSDISVSNRWWSPTTYV
jgi:hypothetical protein